MRETIPVAEWLAEARRRFGDDPREWKFRCPCCGNIQTLVDFEKIGAEPQFVYQECIGRNLPIRASQLGAKAGRDGKMSPCDYAAFGLFRALGGAVVISENGVEVPVLPFADPEKENR